MQYAGGMTVAWFTALVLISLAINGRLFLVVDDDVPVVFRRVNYMVVFVAWTVSGIAIVLETL